MDERFFLNSPSQSPFKTAFSSTADTDHQRNGNSPIKKESLSFSPFKNSGLSPFKLINQSPSKGSYDEWDKEFIASFEETLFGMDENVAPHIIEDILRSPAGKAIMENRTSPLRLRNTPAVRRLKISPQNKNMTNSFQCLSHSDNNGVDSLDNNTVIKEEVTTNDHLFGQTMVCVNSNTLSAIDPNKMSATPVKPGLASCENIPKRKLAMKEPGNVQPFQTFVFQENALSGIQQIENDLPSKERLKFARLQFQKVLNMAVEKEIEILQEERRKKEKTVAKASEKENRKQSKNQILKPAKGGKGKQKGKGKKSKYDRPMLKFPQIKMALSNPSLKKKHESNHVSRRLVPEPGKNQWGWYPSDEDDGEEINSKWPGPVPFQTGKNNFYLPEEEEESSEDDDLYSYKFETQSGRQVTWKKRRLY